MIFKNKVHKILLNFFLNMDLIKNYKMSLLQAAYQDNNIPKLIMITYKLYLIQFRMIKFLNKNLSIIFNKVPMR